MRDFLKVEEFDEKMEIENRWKNQNFKKCRRRLLMKKTEITMDRVKA